MFMWYGNRVFRTNVFSLRSLVRFPKFCNSRIKIRTAPFLWSNLHIQAEPKKTKNRNDGRWNEVCLFFLGAYSFQTIWYRLSVKVITRNTSEIEKKLHEPLGECNLKDWFSNMITSSDSRSIHTITKLLYNWKNHPRISILLLGEVTRAVHTIRHWKLRPFCTCFMMHELIQNSFISCNMTVQHVFAKAKLSASVSPANM